MSLISAHDLRKSFGAHSVIDGVTLTITDGERLGLVGQNGSGKSTLARILGGLDEPDQGELMRRRGSRVATLLQVPEYDPDMTAFDTAAQGLRDFYEAKRQHDEVTAKLTASRGNTETLLALQGELGARIEQLGGWDQEHQVRSLLEHLAVPDPNAKVATLSGGEQRRVALAQQLLSRPDLLILDEPTNHLDTETSDWLEQYLSSQFKGALLLITHDRYFLDRLVTRTLEMSQGTLTSYEGGWQQYLEGKAEREALEARTEANRQNFLRKEIEWLRRQPKARGTKQKARIERANDAIDKNAPAVHGNVQLAMRAQRQGSDILEFADVQLTIGERVLVEKLDLLLSKKQRVGILGHNGAGKTTLLRAAIGELTPTRGKVKLGKTTQIAYFDQTRSELDEGRSIAENVSDGPKVSFAGQELSIYSYLARFLFRSEEIHKKVSMLSGGERARVALAKLLLRDCNLLLLDEPTNDLDVMTLASLEQMLLDFAGSVLVVTHDRYFLNRVATDILAFEGDGKVVHYVGNYDTYKSLRPANVPSATTNAQNAPPAPSDATTDDGNPTSLPTQPQSTGTAKRPPKLTYNEQRELEGMMERIDELETRVSELEAQLSDPEFYRGEAARAAEVQATLEQTRSDLETQMARWEELESKREAFESAR